MRALPLSRSRIGLILSLALLFLNGLAFPGVAPGVSSGTPPNVIFVLADDQGWWDVGVYGNPDIDTPVMDRLAGESARMTHFYVQPLCAPSRASLLTGRHNQRSRVVDTYMGLDTMDLSERTLGQLFQDHGYRTALIGKWHLGRYFRYLPTQRGFDQFFGLPLALITHYFEPDQLFSGTTKIATTGYITDILTDQAIRFVEDNADHPFFLYLAYNAAHSPYLVPDSYIEPYLKKGLTLRDARIYGMLTSLDDNLARLLETVDRKGLRERTILVFMSDNGGMSRHFRAGLRGEKGLVYEGGVRVPFMVRWPGQIPQGLVIDAPGEDVDLYPTLCELTGIPLPPEARLDGKSIAPLLRGETTASPHDYVFHQWNHIRPVFDLPSPPIPHPSPPEWDADHPVVLGGVPFWAVQEVRTGYKLVRWTFRERGKLKTRDELYNLHLDPGESRDVAASHPEIVRRLRERFLAWFNDVTSGVDYSRAPIEIGYEEENPVEIELLRATATGPGVKLSFNRFFRDVIEEWTNVGTSVVWQIDVVRPGSYEVTLDYGCDEKDAGSTVEVSLGEARLTYTVEPTAGSTVSRPRTLGELTVKEGHTELKITPLTLKGGNIMNIYGIHLKQVE